MSKKEFSWARLFRVMIAMTVVLAMLLCGCAGTGGNDEDDSDGEGSSQNGNEGGSEGGDKGGSLFGDGDGKAEPQDVVDSITNIYGNLLSAFGGNVEAESYGYEMDLVLSIGDEIISMLESQLADQDMNMNLSFMESVGVGLDVFTNKDMMRMKLAASLGGTPVVSGDVIMDLAGSMVYLAIPELSSKYLAAEADFSGMNLSSGVMAEQLEEYADLINALPSDKKLNAMLTCYLEAAMGELDTPTATTETLSYGGVSQSVTANTYDVYRSDVLDMLEAVLTAMKTDKDLEEAVDAISQWYNQENAEVYKDYGETWTNVDMYEELMDTVDEALEDLQEAKQTLDDALFLQVIVYTSNDSLVGVAIEMDQDAYSSLTATVYSITSGSSTAFYAEISGVQFAGTGTVSGGKNSGSYTLTTGGEKILTVELKDFDENVLRQDELKGTITLSLGDALIQRMDMDGVISEETKVEIVLDIDETTSNIKLNLYDDGKFILSLDITGKLVEAGVISAPSNTVDTSDQNALQSWAESLSLDTILDNLEKAGVPSELVDSLEQAIFGGSVSGGNANNVHSDKVVYG